jgi:hypothetical protein
LSVAVDDQGGERYNCEGGISYVFSRLDQRRILPAWVASPAPIFQATGARIKV